MVGSTRECAFSGKGLELSGRLSRWMGCIRVESKSKIILPIDLLSSLIYQFGPKISAGARPGTNRE